MTDRFTVFPDGENVKGKSGGQDIGMNDGLTGFQWRRLGVRTGAISRILLAFLLVTGVVVASIGSCTFSTYNTLIDDEEGLVAQEKQIDIALDKMVKKIQAAGFVVSNFRETMIEVLGNTIGQGGRAASGGKFFQAVSERYPDVPSRVWEDLAATQNAEYEAFAANQSTIVAKMETFRKHLRKPHYKVAKMMGDFPTIDMDRYNQLILGSEARTARKTGEQGTIDPFGDRKKETPKAEEKEGKGK